MNKVDLRKIAHSQDSANSYEPQDANDPVVCRLQEEIEELRDELQERLDRMPEQLQESSILNKRIKALEDILGRYF